MKFPSAQHAPVRPKFPRCGRKSGAASRRAGLGLLLLGLISCSALAESGAYRVEVIVFQNLDAQATADETDVLRDFSRFPALEDSELPDDFSVVTKKSGAMNQAWRRLQSSRAYHPLLYAGWEQERIEYYPPIHIHDGQVVGTRLRTPGTAASMPPAPGAEEPAAPPQDGLGNSGDVTAAAVSPAPAYDNLYQLDGTVQLRRSRFLHVDVDLEYRLGSGELPAPDAGQNFDATIRVYHFSQGRQVDTGEMQYFDSPYFGALVLVTAVP